MQDIYNIIVLHGGPTSLVGVIRLGPSKDKPTEKQLLTSLSNLVYRGYLNVDKSNKDHRWIIATKSYWRTRQAYVKAAYAASKLKRKKHDTYIKAKAKKKRKLIATKPKIKVAGGKAQFVIGSGAGTSKSNGVLRVIDLELKSLTAQQQGIAVKVAKLRVYRSAIAQLEL